MSFLYCVGIFFSFKFNSIKFKIYILFYFTMPILSSMGLIFFFYLFKILYFILFCFSVFTVLCGTCFLLYLFFFHFIYWEKTHSKCLLTIKYSMLPCIMLKFLLQVHFIYLLISSFIHIRFFAKCQFWTCLCCQIFLNQTRHQTDFRLSQKL